MDARILTNHVRTALAAWSDRLIALIMVLGGLLALRAGLAGEAGSWPVYAATGVGALVAIRTAASLAARLDVLVADGILASEALEPRHRRRYLAAWHGLAATLITVLAVFVSPSLAVFMASGYVAAAVVASAVYAAPALARSAGLVRPARRVCAALRTPAAGCVAALALLMSLIFTRALPPDVRLMLLALSSLCLLGALTLLDAAVVRFMTLCGHGTGRIVLHHAGAVAPFCTIATVCALVLDGPIAAGVVLATSGAGSLLLGLRVMAYRLFSRRLGDVVVSLVVAFNLFAAWSLSFAAPFVIVIALGGMVRRSRARSWLLS